MPKLTGGQALIQSLYREGIRTVFGIPGQGQYEAVDALYEEPNIRYISVRHEQATSYMADGYARAGGGIAAALVVPGPGVLNATAGMATAYAVSSPILIITGADHLRQERKGKRPQGAAFSPLSALTKWTARATRAAQLPELVHEAMANLRTGRPRPVALEVPHAVLAAAEEVSLCDSEEAAPPRVDGKALERVLAQMRRAQRPLIWAGGGVNATDANALVTELAERWQAPVVTSRSGKGAISDRHPLSLGMGELRYAPLREWIDTCDLILALGTSKNFDEFSCDVIKVDIDPDEIGDPAGGLLGDVRTVLSELLAAVESSAEALAPAQPDIIDKVAGLNAQRFDPGKQLQPQWDFMRAIRAALPDDAIVVQGMNQMGYYSRNYYPVYTPRGYLTSSSLSTLGAAYPLALGAQLARPERPVVALCGDGGFLYNMQELATAVQYQIPVIAIVFNDNAYGNVLRAQQEQFDGHVLGTRLHNPDFAQVAHNFGAHGVRVNDPTELEAALRSAVAEPGPALIEVPVGEWKREF